MEEELDIDKIMLGLGFSKEHDATGDGYSKEIVLCNSNCIGCEYKISFEIHTCNGGAYDAVGIMYKPLVRDSEICMDGSRSDQPHSRICILNKEISDIEDAVYACAHTLAKVMVAMDFRQISGTDFVNLSDCSREEIMNEFEKQSYTNIYVPFNSRMVQFMRGSM